ncbi:hypothetical protein O181_132832 [Austropuccinia psidii MF-1]|uniref:Uncharacterized protein n=1 Tax=Austropuccinia psidii MF-1 TaxID=1389203 RepID=A0A9Q3L7T9_9BASI|nr:hypothetical protein [Austropuccinia psidii MF-1]
MPSTRSGASYNPSSSYQKGYRSYNTVLPLNRADTSTRSLSGHKQSQPERLQQFNATQRVPDPCRSVEKLHELLPDCEKISGTSQNLQVTQWMASIDGKEKYDAFNSRMKEKQHFTTQASAKNSPSSQKQLFQCGKRSHKLRTRAKAKHQLQQITARATKSQRFSRTTWKMYFRWPEQMELQKKEEARLKYQK